MRSYEGCKVVMLMCYVFCCREGGVRRRHGLRSFRLSGSPYRYHQQRRQGILGRKNGGSLLREQIWQGWELLQSLHWYLVLRESSSDGRDCAEEMHSTCAFRGYEVQTQIPLLQSHDMRLSSHSLTLRLHAPRFCMCAMTPDVLLFV